MFWGMGVLELLLLGICSTFRVEKIACISAAMVGSYVLRSCFPGGGRAARAKQQPDAEK